MTKIKCIDFFSQPVTEGPISDSEIVDSSSQEDDMEDIPCEYDSVKKIIPKDMYRENSL